MPDQTGTEQSDTIIISEEVDENKGNQPRND